MPATSKPLEQLTVWESPNELVYPRDEILTYREWSDREAARLNGEVRTRRVGNETRIAVFVPCVR